MRIVEYHDLLNPDLFQISVQLILAWQDVKDSILRTDWPHGSGSFTIYPESGKKRGEGNGVKPIKTPCIAFLKDKGWVTEQKIVPDLVDSTVINPGDIDAIKITEEGYVAFEWETGNISSSHRAVNKLLVAMQETNTIGSFLVVPSNSLKNYLTDRVGNIGELKPYFPLWKNIPHIKGALRVVVVEHDEVSFEVPRIPKGTDGRSAN